MDKTGDQFLRDALEIVRAEHQLLDHEIDVYRACSKFGIDKSAGVLGNDSRKVALTKIIRFLDLPQPEPTASYRGTLRMIFEAAVKFNEQIERLERN